MPNYAAIDNAAASGATAVVPGVAGKRIRVLNYTLVGAGAVTAQWKSGSTALSGPMTIGAAGGGVSASAGGTKMDMLAVFETLNPGDALNLVAGSAVQISGHVAYDYFTQ